MSGIIGIIDRWGRAVVRADLEEMLARIRHRGPDRCQVWVQDRVGFGHSLLWTTPESMQEYLPLVDPRSGVILTADARIDNRHELIRDLDLHPLHPQHSTLITDSEIILAAYLRWGSACPERLLGDFAFGIWDPRANLLFCARDPMGVKPFYYRLTDRHIAFASELQALLVLTQQIQINERCLADYLHNHRGKLKPILTDPQATLFQDLWALPAASWLRISPDRVDLNRYWQLDPDKEIRLSSDREYAEAFLDLFQKTVSCRLRSAFPIGIQLSGGLDSSSVACVAQRLRSQTADPDPIRTFSAIFPHLTRQERDLSDERDPIDRILNQGGFQPHLWSADQLSPLRDPTSPDRIYWHPDSWFLAPNLYLTRSLQEQAGQQGVRVLLDGYEGDLTLSHGFPRLWELAQQGRWIELAVQVGAVRAVHHSPWQIYGDLLRQFGPNPVLAALRSLKRPWRKSIVAPEPQPQPQIALLDPDFAQGMELQSRYRHHRQEQQRFSGVRGEHYQGMITGLIPLALQALDRSAAAAGLEARHPFYDRRLLEFCLALPAEQKLNQGWSRIILRRAMAGILPRSIQWRVRKADLSPSFHRNFWTQERDLLMSDQTFESIRSYVDLREIQRLRTTYRQAQDRDDFTTPIVKRDGCALWYLTQLAIWLDRLHHP